MDYDITYDDATHLYRINGEVVPSVTAVIRAAGLGPDYSTIDFSTLNHAADRGTKVHLATELIDEDELNRDSLDPELAGYVAAYDQLLADGFKRLRSEQIVADPVRRYAGRMDGNGTWLFGDIIVDIKCTTLTHPSTGIQLAAYQAAANMPKHKRYAIHLYSDGKYRLIKYDSRDDLKMFYSALQLWWWKAKNQEGFYDNYCTGGSRH